MSSSNWSISSSKWSGQILNRTTESLIWIGIIFNWTGERLNWTGHWLNWTGYWLNWTGYWLNRTSHRLNCGVKGVENIRMENIS